MTVTHALDFSDALESLDWADAQVDIVAREMAAFFKAQPYTITREPEGDGVNDAIYMELRQPIPNRIRPIVASAIQSQRNSLDYMTVELAKANGAEKLTDVYFPVCETEDALSKKGARNKIRRLSAEHQNAILSLKPYFGGNDFLYALHWLNIKSKHQRLHAVGGATHLASIGGPNGGRFFGIRTFSPTLLPNQREKIAITPSQTDCDLNFSVDVTFCEIAGQKPRISLVPLLHTFSKICRTIIDDFGRI